MDPWAILSPAQNSRDIAFLAWFELKKMAVLHWKTPLVPKFRRGSKRGNGLQADHLAAVPLLQMAFAIIDNLKSGAKE